MRVRLSSCALAGALIASLGALPAQAQLVTNSAVTPQDLVDALVGAGPNAPTVSNVVFTGAAVARGTFSGGTGIIGFESGIILSSGNIANVVGPNVQDGITTVNNTPGDADLGALIPQPTFDACSLEFDFECDNLQVISFQYVFASDEYNEFVNTTFNDVFAFFVNGVNVALLPDNVTVVSINNVNCGGPTFGTNPSNCAFYINNDLTDGGGAINTEMDGLTVVLNVFTTVNPGVNHIKLAIADAGDRNLDSVVFIKGESLTCAPPPPPEVLVSVDIKPGSCPNALGRRVRGVLPVAILGAAGYDIADIDLSTIVIAREDGVGGSVPAIMTSVEDAGTPFTGDPCGCHTAGGDGVDDLSVKFNSVAVVSILQLNALAVGSEVLLEVSGLLNDGTPFRGVDCVLIVN